MEEKYRIKTAKFMTSISDINVYKEVCDEYECDEICVTGRSNVGKSSFINMLAGQKKLAKTSSTPGRTRLLNLFDFNDLDFVLVDLPGYGYAKASKTDKAKWGQLIEKYFSTSKKLSHVFALIDSRHDPTVLDLQMIKYLYASGFPFSIIATKCDKIKRSQLPKHLQNLANKLGVGVANIIATSAEDKRGRDKVEERLGNVFFFDSGELGCDEIDSGDTE